jgi:hypothetical protein
MKAAYTDTFSIHIAHISIASNICFESLSAIAMQNDFLAIWFSEADFEIEVVFVCFWH